MSIVFELFDAIYDRVVSKTFNANTLADVLFASMVEIPVDVNDAVVVLNKRLVPDW